MSLAPLIDRFKRLTSLTEQDTCALQRLPFALQQVGKYRDAIIKGETPLYLYVILNGWAGRYNLRSDGSRRITSYLLPGDFCGIHAVCHAPMDHSIVALTNCTLARIDLTHFHALIAGSPAIERALWQAKLIDEAILRTWLLNSDDALRTKAHLLCELEARLYPDALDNERKMPLPITQEQLGDALGLTPVHVNRIMRQLRERGLATAQQGTLHIPDLTALRKEASFDPSYLLATHASKERRGNGVS